MTFKEYRESLQPLQGMYLETPDGKQKSLADTMIESMDIWNNDACKGYSVLAMQRAGVDRDTIENVLNEYRDIFEFTSVEQAERFYNEMKF